MSALLEIKNLRKIFPVSNPMRCREKSIRAVDGVDLTVWEREHVGLVGESGSGKSTLARLIVKLYSADGGEIFLNGREVARVSQRAFRSDRVSVQMVFQDPYSSLDPRFTVRRILREAVGLLSEKFSRDQEDEMMSKMLKKVGLNEGALSRFPHEFSGGERQRIAIARALMTHPRILILDEAVSALDVLIQAQIIALLKDLEEEFGLTYLFITHNLRVVRQLCHRIAVMYHGKIIEIAPTEALFLNPLHPYTRKLLSAALDYKSVNKDGENFFKENSHLIDKGNGHFVID